jgi:hypothetical protein
MKRLLRGVKLLKKEELFRASVPLAKLAESRFQDAPTKVGPDAIPTNIAAAARP